MIKVFEAMSCTNLHEVCSAFRISLDSLKVRKPGRRNRRRRPKNRKRPQLEPI